MQSNVLHRARGVLLASALIALPVLGAAIPQTGLADPFAVVSSADEVLLPVRVDKQSGKILITLPTPDADGLSGRFL